MDLHRELDLGLALEWWVCFVAGLWFGFTMAVVLISYNL